MLEAFDLGLGELVGESGDATAQAGGAIAGSTEVSESLCTGQARLGMSLLTLARWMLQRLSETSVASWAAWTLRWGSAARRALARAF